MRVLWTDGSASPNPGPGGFAVIENGKPVRLGRENPSTNIRMEGLALCAAMEMALVEGGGGSRVGDRDGSDDRGEGEGERFEIRTDSEFWVNVITKWAPGWKARGWKKASKGEIQNLEIVQRANELYEKAAGRVKLVWVRGHAGTEMNELADEWANRARKGEEI